MKYAVLSDVHANYPALEAVVADFSEDVDGVIYVGDVVGLMGFPEEVVTELMEIADHAVKGNHDVAVVEREEGHVNSDELSKFELELTHSNLSNTHTDWVASLSAYEEVPEEGLLIAHAKPTPEKAIGIGLRNSGVRKRKFTQVAANVDTDVFDYVFLGHTHQQAALDCAQFGNDVTVVNPGSVGQPMGTAEYATVDTETGEVNLHTVKYDKQAVIDRLEREGVPEKWWN